VHNFYRGSLPSGEDLNVREHQSVVGPGVEVVIHATRNTYVGDHPVAGRWRAFTSGVDLRSEGRALADAVMASRPDCVHIENLAPLLPESMVTELAGRLPVVRRWNNFRFRCPSGNNFRDGDECHDCDQLRLKAPAVRHRCYASSRAASASMAIRPSPLRGDASVLHVAVSEAIAGALTGSGLGADRVVVIPPAVPASVEVAGTRSAAGREMVFVGSLAPKKGVAELLSAWAALGPAAHGATLAFVGDGPLRPLVEEAAARDHRIALTGAVDYLEARARIRRAHALVVPSVWAEPFGRVAAEALAEGTPAIVSQRGGLADVVDASCGWVFEPDDSGALERVLDAALSVSDGERSAMADAAVERHRTRFSIAAVRAMWHDVYGTRGRP
jgi:glycosyltransferase involved in cell wall biosynthesis